ncbi:MAG: SMP-30/gluconolactonase/LRE family protein [Pirellulales bacterium]
MVSTLVRAFRLRCPRCGEGRLFRGLVRMNDSCSACGASFRREQGFYLGSIYINYGATVIGTGALYAILVFACGWSHEAALVACLVAAVAFPVWFFRWARSLLLALDGTVNRAQAAGADPAGGVAALAGDDARAGCAMGVALVLILLFGLGMALVTILVAVEADAADLVPTVGSIERLDPRLDALVPPNAAIEVLAMGFEWAEGPVWMPATEERGACLLFSDVPRNRVNRWRPGSGVDVFLEPAGFSGPHDYGHEPGSNGLTLDREGRLVICEHGDRRVSRLEPGGGRRTLADEFGGQRLNSPNDVVVHSSGAIYFTDPPYGLPKQWEDPRRELDHCGVYRIGVDGRLTLLCRTMSRPNGLAFSPDETTLYVAQSDPAAPVVKSFRVLGDGTLDEGRTFFDASRLARDRRGLPDGLKVDATGNVFATGPGGVLVLAPDGTHLGTLLTGQATANCGFGEDGSTLFITADSLLCRVRLTTKGLLPDPVR